MMLISELLQHIDTLVVTAQNCYDEWDQNVDGFDEELGYGGICHVIADAMCSALSEVGIECSTTSSTIGENHVWLVAKLDDGVVEIDIPPHVYEVGSGYVWRKKMGIQFSAEDIIVNRLSDQSNDYEKYTETRSFSF